MTLETSVPIELPPLEFSSSATQAERAYETIRRDVLWGILKPGEHLTGETLRARYNIGPTPIREALIRLTEIGLLQTEERRGFRVPPITKEDLLDIIKCRQLLECEAIRQAIINASAEWESRVIAAYHQMFRVEEAAENSGVLEWELWEKHHVYFHEVLIAGAKSPRIDQLHRTLYDQANRYRRILRPLVTQIDQAKLDHKKIMDLMISRSAEEAAEALKDHIGRLYIWAEDFDKPEKSEELIAILEGQVLARV